MKMWKEYASKAVTVFGVTWKKDFGFVLKEIFSNRKSSFYKGALKFNRKSNKEMQEDVHMRSHSHERDITAEVFCTLHYENKINLQAHVFKSLVHKCMHSCC